MRYAFGDYILDLAHYELRQAGRLVPMEPRVFDLLVYFVQHPGRLVTLEELRQLLYPDDSSDAVLEDRLTNAISQARKALHDTGQTKRYIQNMRRRGYRFIAPVQVLPLAQTDVERLPAPDTAEQPSLNRAEAGSPPLLVLPVLSAVPLSTQEMASAPRTTEQGRPEAEWRQLTVLTCRVISAPPLSKPLDPEVLLEVARDYQAMCTEIVHRFAGYMAQYQRDLLVAYFGYPHAHEDDARRAVHTGLGIVAGMAELNRRLKCDRGVQLAVRVGIHTGIVVVSARSQDEREPPALGDTPTIAAQVQSLGAPDTVVVSPATLRLVERYFDCRPLGTHMLDDPAELLAVYQILQESTAQSRGEDAITSLTPLVGRDHEIGLLQERWARVKEGLGQVVLLSGEAGIGKSRLIQELKEYLIEETYVRYEYYCSPYYQQSAFYPLVDHLQRLLRFRPDDSLEEKLHTLEDALTPYGFSLEEAVPLLAAFLSLPPPAHYPPLTLTPQQQKQKTLETLLVWLLKETERQPVCFIMEDLHWVDPSTLEFLNLLIEQVPTARMLLLLPFRPDFSSPWGGHSYLTHIALGGLSRRQVETMVERITGGKALPAEVLQELVAKTDGVPLFVEELTKMVLESGLVKEREGRYELAGPLSPLAIPTTLYDSLMARLDRLGRAKQVAQLGATLGREFAYEVIQAVAPVDEATLQQALVQLVAAELLYQRGLPPQARYRFKHALIQEAAYHSLLRRRRQQYHRQIAQVLAERFPKMAETQPELLAYHYMEADLPEQAIPYWQRAGQRAIERLANLEAIGHLTKALEVLKTLPATPERTQQELTLQLALGAPLLMVKGHTAPEVEHAYTRAYALCQQAGDSPERFLALLGLRRFYANQGAYERAQELLKQLFRLAQSLQNPVFLSQAHSVYGQTLFHRGDFTSALAHLEQGIALYAPQKHYPQAFLYGIDPGVLCLCYAARALWFLGYPDQALRKNHEALTLARQLSRPYTLGCALHFTSALHTYRREMPLAQEMAEATIALAKEQGFVRWFASGMIRRGWALAMQGSSEEGIMQLNQGLATWQALGTKEARLQHRVLLADAYGKGEQIEAGLRTLAEAAAVLHENAERDYEAEFYRLKGELLLQAGRRQQVEEAEGHFLQALNVARHQHAKSPELRAAMGLCRLWQKQGKRVEAYQMLAEIYGWFTEGFDTPDLREAKALLDTLW